MNKNYKIFNNYKDLGLNYIRFPISLAYKMLRGDLSRSDTTKEFKVIKAHWKLAAAKFAVDMGRGEHLGFNTDNGMVVSKSTEIKYFLTNAEDLLKTKERALTHYSVR